MSGKKVFLKFFAFDIVFTVKKLDKVAFFDVSD